MSDKHYELLMGIQKELSTNTEATKGIVYRLDSLNGKVATNSKKIGKITIALIIVGTALATMAVTQNPELVNLILKLI